MEVKSQSLEEWRCHACNKLLAKRQSHQIHICIGDKYRYVVDGKVTSVCPRCQALNSDQTNPASPIKK